MCEQLGAGVVVGGAVIIGFRGGNALHATAGGRVVRVDAQNVFVLALGVVVLAEVVVAFSRVEFAADLIDILGMLIGERRIGADWVVEIGKFAFRLKIVRVLRNHRFEKRAGFGIFADLAVLHRESDAGVTEVSDVTLAAIGEARCIGHALNCLCVLVDRLLVIAFGIGLTAFGKKAITLDGGVLAAKHFALRKVAVTVTAFAGVGDGHDAGQGACQSHQGHDAATGEN